MRIGSGDFRGRTLRTPKGEATRPTSGLVRESLFNILAPVIDEARVLDLFAGCGSVGLEAISRGAASAAFVEKGRPALQCLQENITALGVNAQARVLPYPVERSLDYLDKHGESFDIIFLDPPFADRKAYTLVLQSIADGQILAEDGIVIAQHDTRLSLPDTVGNLTRYRLREIGDNALSFYRKASQG